MACPDENVLAAYVDDELAHTRRATVEEHIDRCEACRTVVSDLARLQANESDMTDAQPTATPYTTGAQTVVERLSGGRIQQIVTGTQIGEYVVTGPLGAGGMGTVYAAVHPRIGKRAAIKVLRRDFASDPRVLVRFENEARAVNAIGHDNIVDIFAFGELPDGNPYFVMEYVEGENLGRWMRRHGAVSLAEAMPILRRIFDAVATAHERGIIHRDLKPGNIVVGGTDTAPAVTVLDFGLAKMAPEYREDDIGDLTNPGVVLGTPSFMSPEQLRGAAIDHRSDIYALGVLVYHMLCGRPPFEGATPTEVGLQHLHEAPARPSSLASLPTGVDNVLVSALAKDPEQRPATVRAFLDALERCVVVVPEVVLTRPRSRRWQIASFAVLSAIVIGLVVSSRVLEQSASDAAEPARPQMRPVAVTLEIDAGTLPVPVARADAGGEIAVQEVSATPPAVAPPRIPPKTVRRTKPTKRKPSRARTVPAPAPAPEQSVIPAPATDDDMLLAPGEVKKAR